jgi:hypothetical protein
LYPKARVWDKRPEVTPAQSVALSTGGDFSSKLAYPGTAGDFYFVLLNTLKARRYTLAAFLITALALFMLLTRESIDRNWLQRWNHVALPQVELIDVVFLGVFALAFPFEPRLVAAARRKGVRWIVLALATLTCFLLPHLLEPSQKHRLFVTPLSVWIIIVHGAALSALAVLLAARQSEPAEAVSRHIPYGAWVVALALGFVLVVLHLTSIANFMELDLPDEPSNASVATNFAENNDLSNQFVGSPYGSPDVVFPRYYLVMGLWLKLAGNSSLWTMRVFPVIVAGLTAALFAFGLWRLSKTYNLLTRGQILLAVIILLSLSAFVRDAHNLRMDIMLAFYSALLLWGMLSFWSDSPPSERGGLWRSGKSRAAVLMGTALFVGMEGVPTVALPMSVVTGAMLVLWGLRQPQKRRAVGYIVLYAAVSFGSITAYYAGQFLPDINASLEHYRAFLQFYGRVTDLGAVQLNTTLSVLSLLARFSLILSPVELMGGLLAMGFLWYVGSWAERWMLAVIAVSFVVISLFAPLSYGYLAVFAPFMAYAVARSVLPAPSATAAQRAVYARLQPVVCFVFIPALLAAPIFDMSAAVEQRGNETLLQAVDTLTPAIPPGTTVVADDVFWFTLHPGRTVLGQIGLVNYMRIHNFTYPEAIKALKVDALLCVDGDRRCPTIVATGLFGEPTEYTLAGSLYRLYWRAK